mmetsp:Transcript_5223/g.8086  ORF Transcript_5223/g.8086 Transcript_5223/m.8086 type:complete len:294 (+) Transcript_5223:1832-2713(+)
MAVHDGVSELSLVTLQGALEDDRSRNRKHNQDANCHNHALNRALEGLEGAVLPDDVGGFGGLLQFDLAAEELIVVLVVLLLDMVVVEAGTRVAFFGLKGGEHGTGALHLIKQVLVLSEVAGNGLVDIIELVPLFSLDESSSFLEPVDDSGVVISKRNLGDLDRLVFVAVHSKVGEVRNTLLQLQLDVQLELGGLAHGVGLIVVVLLKVLINFLVDIELDGVVTSGDRFDIKVDKLVLLHRLDVVEVHHCEQVDQHSQGSAHETTDLSHVDGIRVDVAGGLQEEQSIVTALVVG